MAIEITHLVWKQAISFIRNVSAMDNYQDMTGPEALREAANAMEMAVSLPSEVMNG